MQQPQKELWRLVCDPGVAISCANSAAVGCLFHPLYRRRYNLFEAGVVVHRSCQGTTLGAQKNQFSQAAQQYWGFAAGASSNARAGPQETELVPLMTILSVYGT